MAVENMDPSMQFMLKVVCLWIETIKNMSADTEQSQFIHELYNICMRQQQRFRAGLTAQPPVPNILVPGDRLVDERKKSTAEISEKRLSSGKGDKENKPAATRNAPVMKTLTKKTEDHSPARTEGRLATGYDLCGDADKNKPSTDVTLSRQRKTQKSHHSTSRSSSQMNPSKKYVKPRVVDPNEDPKAVIDRRLSLVGPRYGPDGSRKAPRFINPPYTRKSPRKPSPPWLKPTDLSKKQHKGLTKVTTNEEVTALLDADWRLRAERGNEKENQKKKSKASTAEKLPYSADDQLQKSVAGNVTSGVDPSVERATTNTYRTNPEHATTNTLFTTINTLPATKTVTRDTSVDDRSATPFPSKKKTKRGENN